ncbi:MAG TPA: hypothetical protein VEO00_07230, partial [Actinomycetota bacterium]|nr:hypothetical protein [Actinomycetota bacterium]
RGDLTARLYREAEVLSNEAAPEGQRIRVRVPERLVGAVTPFLLHSVSTGGGTTSRRAAPSGGVPGGEAPRVHQ